MRIKLLLTPRYDTDPYERDENVDVNLGRMTSLPPLGIATLTASLKRNHFSVSQDDLLIKTFYHNLSTKDPAKMINLRIFNDEKRIENFIARGYDPQLEAEGEKILKLTNCARFDVFGLSLYETFNSATAGVGLVLAKLLKEKYGSTILIGGDLHYYVALKMLRTKFVDYCIYGRGAETQLLHFCHNFECGVPLEKTPGIYFTNQEGEIVREPIHGDLERRRVPTTPCFDGLPLDLYRSRGSVNVEGTDYEYEILVLPYIFVNGCPKGCAYCEDSVGGWVAKQPEEVAADLQELSKKYRTRYFFFINTEINPTYEYAERVASALIDHDVNIKWSDCATFFDIDEHLLKKLRRAGAVTLVFGLESASRKILRYVQKPLPPLNHIIKILKISYELGIRNELDIICGFPYETERDVELTIRFLLRVGKYVQQYHVSKFRPSGRMARNPERWGIRLLSVDPLIRNPGHAVPFNELTGLGWKAKAKQIDYYYRKITQAIRSIRVRLTRLPAMSMDEFLYLRVIKCPLHQLISCG
jgi:pyruvate-formate lyase-activating enzyme